MTIESLQEIQEIIEKGGIREFEAYFYKLTEQEKDDPRLQDLFIKSLEIVVHNGRERLLKDLLEMPEIKNEIRKNINTPPPDDNLLLLAIRRGHQIIVAILLEMKDAIENESACLWALLVAQLMLKMTPKYEKSRYQSIMDRLEESLKRPQKALLPYMIKKGRQLICSI